MRRGGGFADFARFLPYPLSRREEAGRQPGFSVERLVPASLGGLRDPSLGDDYHREGLL